MSDELAERLYVWLAVKSFGQVTALQAGSRVADLIRKDPQAHIDALVEAGVLERRPLENGFWFDRVGVVYHVPPPVAPPFGATVRDSGGGCVELVVDRDTPNYPRPGSHVRVVPE